MTVRVVKIQRALNDPSLPGLIYDQSRRFYEPVILTPETLGLMGDKTKIYARVETSRAGPLRVVAVLPDQGW